MMIWKAGKLQSYKIEYFCCLMLNCTSPCTNPFCLNFTKYYSSWLHVSSQLSLLHDCLIIRKYIELNYSDHALQININPDENITQWLNSVQHVHDYSGAGFNMIWNFKNLNLKKPRLKTHHWEYNFFLVFLLHGLYFVTN